MRSHSRCLNIGVTSDLSGRVWEHKTGIHEGFTKNYKIDQLVYHELIHDIESAIAPAKQLKGWKRAKKIALIEKMNRAGTTSRFSARGRSFDSGSAYAFGKRSVPLAFAQDDGALETNCF